MIQRCTWLPWALGLLLVGVVFAEVLAGQTFFYSDYSLIYHPLLKWAYGGASDGVPGWNPDIGMGLPQAANPILGTFYPLLLPLHILPFTWGLNALIVGHFALAFGFTTRLLNNLGVDRWGQLVGGLSFALGGALVSSTSYVFPIFAWAWVPLFLLGVRTSRVVLMGPALALTLLAGAPLACVMAVLMSPAFITRRAQLVRLAAGVGLGGLLAAIQLVPTALFVGDSVRSGGADAAAGIWSFHPARFIELIMPDFFGRWAPEYSFWGGHLTDDRKDGNFFYYSAYAGLVPLLLAPLAYRQKGFRPLLFLIVLFFVLALGRNGPIYPIAVETIPGFNLFRYPEKWVQSATLMLACLGAMGFAALHKETSKSPVYVACGLVALAALGVLLAGGPLRGLIAEYARVPQVEDAARSVQVWGAGRALCVAALVAACVALRHRFGGWRAAIAIIAALDIASAAHTLVWTGPPDLFESGAPMAESLGSGRLARHNGLDRTQLHRDLSGLAEVYRRNGMTLRANLALEVGARRVGAESPARIGHPVQPEDWLWHNPGQVARVLGAPYLFVSSSSPPATVVSGLGQSISVVTQIPGLDLLVVRPTEPVLPEVYCINAVEAVHAEGVLEALQATDPLQLAVVEPAARTGPKAAELLAELGAARPEGARDCARWTRSADEWLIEVDTPVPVLLVLQDAFAPGWEAYNNQKPLAVVRTYGSLKGIPIPAGTHRIRVSYTLPGLLAGVCLTALGLLVLLWVLRRELAGSE